MSSAGYGFREVLVDQPFSGKWMDVDMNIGGGHSTFQGTKFSDFAGGYSYKLIPSPRQIMQNRCIYWRTLNDTLELTETSLDYNLHDNQVRYIFRDSPIVGPITIQETNTTVIILVATVTSVNRFVFTHPRCLVGEEGKFMKNNQPSIFYQVINKPSMNFRSFNLYDHSINIPVPTSAASYFIPNTGDSVFALSYESGSISLYKISRDETLSFYDLRQSNIFARILSGFTPSILRGASTTSDAVIGLNFFTAKLERTQNALFIVTLSMNGHLRIWMCNNLVSFTDWTVFSNGVVDKRFAVDGYTDSSMLLRRTYDNDSNELPNFFVFIPGEGFKMYHVAKNMGAVQGSAQLVLQESKTIDFKDRDIMDFTVTAEYLFILVTNPEEETEWEVKSYRLNENLNPRFNLALLEPLPYPDVPMFPITIDPKDFYFDLIFNKSSFSAPTIYKALSMFQNGQLHLQGDTDWEKLKIYAMNVIDYEIGIVTSSSDCDISDDDYCELNLKFWLMFYNSCVEYHIHTVKPLGIFYETNTRMLCIVKKSRISFLRPTDLLETLYYFPHCIPLSDASDPGDDRTLQLSMVLKYLEVLDTIESTADESHKSKVDKRLRENHASVEDVCNEIAILLTEADPLSLMIEQRHFIPLLSSKLKDLGEHGDNAMKLTLSIITNWEREEDTLESESSDEIDDRLAVTEFFMGSRLGANITCHILKQLLQHRFMIARNTMLLQSLISNFFYQNNEEEGIKIGTNWNDRRDASMATTCYFALMKIAERSAEVISDFVLDKGLKIANILRSNTSDHLIQGKLAELWPMKLFEMFCNSTSGGLAIRSRVNITKKSSILAYAEAAGRAIWPNDMTTLEHPFEEFLISGCQYSALLQYGQDMNSYLRSAKPTLKKFYLGLAYLCSGDDDTALGYFRSISMREAWDDPYFCVKMLDFPLPTQQHQEIPSASHSTYYIKVISLFQVFDHTRSVQKLAEDALKVCDDDNSTTRMCSLAFKCALQMGDYEAAYKFIMHMPSYDTSNSMQDRKEKLSSLRMFITKILQRADIEVLINLDLNDMFNKSSTVREQVEDVLFTHANLSDPIQHDGVYQILYLYHLSRQNFHKAASAMYSRAIRIGEKGEGLRALEEQRDSYLDVLTCLSLIEDKQYRWVVRKTGIITELPEPVNCLDDTKIPTLCFDKEIEILQYPDVLRELELCLASLKLVEKVPPQPIKIRDFEKRAEDAVRNLTFHHYYDDAIKIAKLWDLSYVPIISAFANSCCKLMYRILPDSNDPIEYICHNDISELPNSNTSVNELGFRLLQNYLSKLEKPIESTLHQQVTLQFLGADIKLPQFLVDSYKKRNVSQLINCYVRYGDWEEATELSVKVMDAALGRRNADEFDATIQKITSYDPVEPVIPYTIIDQLAAQLQSRIPRQPELAPLLEVLKQRSHRFVTRVLECQQERESMVSQMSRI